MQEKRYVLSYGGGVNSTALLFLILEKNMPLDEVIYAETGCEKPETDKFVPKTKKFCDDNNILFTTIKATVTVKRDLPKKVHTSELVEYCELQKIIPFRMYRSCTDKFKIKPIHKRIRSLAKKTIVYIGFDFGEMHRRRESKVKFIENQFPLIEYRIDRRACEDIIKRNGFEVPVKSGCYICPFQKLDEWKELRKNHPDLFKKAMELEKRAQERNPKAMFCTVPLAQLDKATREQRTLGNYIKSPCEHGFCMT